MYHCSPSPVSTSEVCFSVVFSRKAGVSPEFAKHFSRLLSTSSFLSLRVTLSITINCKWPQDTGLLSSQVSYFREPYQQSVKREEVKSEERSKGSNKLGPIGNQFPEEGVRYAEDGSSVYPINFAVSFGQTINQLSESSSSSSFFVRFISCFSSCCYNIQK